MQRFIAKPSLDQKLQMGGSRICPLVPRRPQKPSRNKVNTLENLFSHPRFLIQVQGAFGMEKLAFY